MGVFIPSLEFMVEALDDDGVEGYCLGYWGGVFEGKKEDVRGDERVGCLGRERCCHIEV